MRKLLRQPDVLLLEEVTSGLDHETRDMFVVSSTHERDLAAKVDETIAPQPLSQAGAPAEETLDA